MIFLGQINLVVIVIQGAARESAVVPMGASPSATIKMMMLVGVMIMMMLVGVMIMMMVIMVLINTIKVMQP